MMNFGSNRRDLDQAKLGALADPKLVEARRRRAEGDLLDRMRVRDGFELVRTTGMLALALGMYAGGELAFAFQAGAAMLPMLVVANLHLPGMHLENVRWGGLLGCLNSLMFIVLFAAYRLELERAPRETNKQGKVKWLQFSAWIQEYRANRWSGPLTVVFALALFSSWVAQTNGADIERAVVDRRIALEKTIADLKLQIDGTTIRPVGPQTIGLNAALDQAVGSGLSRTTEAEISGECGAIHELGARIVCRQQTLRDGVDCTQSMSKETREGVCNQAAFYRQQLADIAKEAVDLQTKRGQLAEKVEELRVTPKASNGPIRSMASWFGMSIADAQAWFYFILSVGLLLAPAQIFAQTLERQRT